MLRNSYFEPYKRDKKKKSEYEKVILNNDGEHILSLERPLSMICIKKLPKNDFPLFVNDLMCNKETGHLLYPLSFSKQVDLYLKEQSYAYKITTFNKNKNFVDMLRNLRRKREKEFEEKKNKTLTSPKLSNFKKREELEEMKVNLNSFKTNKNSLVKKLRSKNRKFFKSQPLIDRKLRKLMFQSVNDIRLRGYEKAFEVCNNKSMTKKDFNLPDITVNESNVYSRLYNNIIVKNKNRKNNQSNIFEDKYKIQNRRLNSPLSNSVKSTSKIQSSFIPNENEIRKKGPDFHISNINKNLNGKEFTKKVTQKMYKRCLSALSGGPRDTLQKYGYRYNFTNKKSITSNIKPRKRFVNYHAKLTSKNCFLKMKPDLNNKKDSLTVDSEKINDLILANSNSRLDLINIKKFRDSNYNTNLHRSVLKNNIKFVEYFIKKNLDVNKKNKNGDTPLHLAFKIGNYDIIQLLLEHGASIKIKNKKGITPFDIADKDMRITFNLVEIYNNPAEH